MKDLIPFILSIDPTADAETIRRCIRKATIVLKYDGIYLIADDEYIYYFGAKESSRTHSKLGKFMKENWHLTAGKKYYTKNNEPFKTRSKQIEDDLYVRTTEKTNNLLKK